MSDIVFFYDGYGSALYLTDVKRDDNGRLKSGTVINGCWKLRIKDDELLACDEFNARIIVNRVNIDWSLCTEVEVPKGLGLKHYNQVIEWAWEQHENMVNEVRLARSCYSRVQTQ